ncbi:hypothetical protein E2C01_094844 [Portunus trituberculatus]|uniref:Uncharacterized protein n=1 Tax=Portunus trituberculatus TaxID=210409 RepID=A0A5B7JN90_PORTR|nr:hypothetical protein [Portunus trituberculatus]
MQIFECGSARTALRGGANTLMFATSTRIYSADEKQCTGGHIKPWPHFPHTCERPVPEHIFYLEICVRLDNSADTRKGLYRSED